MMTSPKDYAQRAANAFNQRDVQGLLALVDEDFVYLRARSHARAGDGAVQRTP